MSDNAAASDSTRATHIFSGNIIDAKNSSDSACSADTVQSPNTSQKAISYLPLLLEFPEDIKQQIFEHPDLENGDLMSFYSSCRATRNDDYAFTKVLPLILSGIQKSKAIKPTDKKILYSKFSFKASKIDVSQRHKAIAPFNELRSSVNELQLSILIDNLSIKGNQISQGDNVYVLLNEIRIAETLLRASSGVSLLELLPEIRDARTPGYINIYRDQQHMQISKKSYLIDNVLDTLTETIKINDQNIDISPHMIILFDMIQAEASVQHVHVVTDHFLSVNKILSRVPTDVRNNLFEHNRALLNTLWKISSGVNDASQSQRISLKLRQAVKLYEKNLLLLDPVATITTELLHIVESIRDMPEELVCAMAISLRGFITKIPPIERSRIILTIYQALAARSIEGDEITRYLAVDAINHIPEDERFATLIEISKFLPIVDPNGITVQGESVYDELQRYPLDQSLIIFKARCQGFFAQQKALSPNGKLRITPPQFSLGC